MWRLEHVTCTSAHLELTACLLTRLIWVHGHQGFLFYWQSVFPPLRESRTITQLEIVTMALWYHGAKMAKSHCAVPINTTIHNLCTACFPLSSHFCLSSYILASNSLLSAWFCTLQMSSVWSTTSHALTSGPYWLPLGSHISQRGSTVVLEGKLSPSGWCFLLQPQEGYASFSC